MISTEIKVLGTILGNLYGITLGFDVRTDLGSLQGSFDCYNDGKIEVLLLKDALVSTDGKVLESDGCIKLVSTDSKVLGTILGNLDGITLRIDVGTELSSLDLSFDGYNDNTLEGLLLGVLLGSTDGKVLGYDKGIILISTDGKVIVTVLGNVYGVTLGIYVGTDLDS